MLPGAPWLASPLPMIGEVPLCMSSTLSSSPVRVAFWIYWLVASIGVKAGRTRWNRFAGVRVGVILVILLLLRVRALKGHAAISDPWLQGTGLAVFLLGLALAIWARVYLGRNWGMPMSQKADPELITTGPYRSIRHPIYSGIILAMIGTTIAVSLYWLAAVVLIGAYFLYSAMVEERSMTRPLPRLVSGVQAVNQDADPLHLLSFRGIVRNGARPPGRHSGINLFTRRRSG